MTDTPHSVDECLTQGHYLDAVAFYEQRIAANPEQFSNYWYLGLVWLLHGDEAEAQAIWFTAIAAIDPDNLDTAIADLLHILTTEAQRQVDLGQFHQAAKLYQCLLEHLLEHDAERASAALGLGNALAQQGQLDEAIAAWRYTTDLQPDRVDAYRLQAEVLQKLGRWDEAIAAYTQVIACPPDWITHYQLGLCLGQQQRWHDALLQFDQVLQLNPEVLVAHGDRGWALLHLGDWDEAIASFAVATRSLNLTHFETAWAEVQQQPSLNLQRYWNVQFLRALQTQPSDIDKALGKLLAAANHPEQAVVAYQRACQQHPSADSYLELGKTLAKLHRWHEAIVAYTVALQLNSASADAYLALGRAQIQVQQDDSAIAAYRHAIQLRPDWADAYVQMGKHPGLSSQEAIACYRHALECQPAHLEALCQLSIGLVKAGDVPGAIVACRRLLDSHPDAVQVVDFVLRSINPSAPFSSEFSSEFNLDLVLFDRPETLYETTWDWVVAAQLETNYTRLDSASLMVLKPPQSLEHDIHYSFRFGQSIELPETFVVTVPNGRFWLDREQTCTAILTAENQLLGDLSPEFPLLSPNHPDKHPAQHWLFSTSRLQPAQMIEGTVAVLSGLSNDMYFHWMFDVLPRIDLLRRAGVSLDAIDGFLVSDRLPFQQETLSALGIPKTKVLSADRHLHIQASQLIVPSFPGCPAWMPQWACKFLRQVFLNQRAGSKRQRLYISRSQASSRKLVNEDDVINLLQQFGFISVILESLSVNEQAELFASADVVISPHGGGLTNLVFCNSGTTVIEIFSPNYVYPCYWLVSNLVDLNYYYLLGTVSEGAYLHQLFYPDSRIDDIWVDLSALQSVLKLAGL
jgi:tetratricopeptide (TPR) repeat protein